MVGDTSFGDARATIGARRGAGEVFAGYDHLEIGGVDLAGPVVGVRVAF